MIINEASSPKPQKPLSRSKLVWHMVWRSTAIGLISGLLLGALFGLFLFFFIWTGLMGAGLGLGLGLVNGLLLSVVTALFFYPLRSARVYRAIAKVMSAAIAGAGAAVFGPWYFSAKSMTPTSAVLIGFSSVLASIAAGWAGGLAGQNLAEWYERNGTAAHFKATTRQTSANSRHLNKPERYLAVFLSSQKAGWISVAVFSLLCFFPGTWILRGLVCGELARELAACLPSPRLYTSVIAGFKVALPITFLVALLIASLQHRYRTYR